MILADSDEYSNGKQFCLSFDLRRVRSAAEARRRHCRQPREATRPRDWVQILHALAQDQSQPSSEGEANPDTD